MSPRSLIRRRSLIILTAVGSFILVSMGLFLRDGTSLDRSPATSQEESCLADGAALIDVSYLPGFDLMVDQQFATAPVKGISDPSRSFVRDFRSGRIVGFIADIAVTGPDRTSEDARAAALGYEIGRFPYVPLTGDVVTHSDGLLEVYDSAFEFASAQAARDWSELMMTSKLAVGGELVTLDGVPPQATVISSFVGPNDGFHERDYTVLVVGERLVLRLEFQGGPSAPPSPDIPRVTGEAVRLLAEACTGAFGEHGG